MDKKFISFTTRDGEVVVNSKQITHIQGDGNNGAIVFLASQFNSGVQTCVVVLEKFEEVKKKLGMPVERLLTKATY